MKLWKYVNKNVKMELYDGTTVLGYVSDWNDEYSTGEDEIFIGTRIYGLSEIKSIEIIDKKRT